MSPRGVSRIQIGDIRPETYHQGTWNCVAHYIAKSPQACTTRGAPYSSGLRALYNVPSRPSSVQRTLLRSDVVRQRPDQRVVGGLLQHVCRPAGYAAHHEYRCEHRYVETHQVVSRSGREVQVRMDALITHHHLLKFLVHAQPFPAVPERRDLFQRRFHRRHPAVPLLVHTVTEAHHLLAARQAFTQPAGSQIRIVDLEHHLHHRFVGATVQRTLEGTHSCGAGAVQVRSGGGDHPGGEGRGIETVLGIQHQGHLERANDLGSGYLPETHVEE